MGRRNADNAASRKTILIFSILEMLAAGRELYAKDEDAREELGCTETQLRDALNEIVDLYPHFIRVTKEKKPYGRRALEVYSLYDSPKAIADGLKRFLQAGNDYDWLVELLHAGNPEIRSELGYLKERAEQTLRDDVFIFSGRPFEQLEDESLRKMMSNLKNAVANYEYRYIEYEGARKQLVFPEAKCLKIIHSENNWYLAVESEERLQLLRVAFIKKVKYCRNKTTYKKSDLLRYADYFENFQNPFTHWNKPFETALFRASPKVARLFRPGMKTFFKSQEFVQEENDGSVLFTVKFTNEMEVLPFVFSWLPDIEVMEPSHLQGRFTDRLNRALSLHGKKDG